MRAGEGVVAGRPGRWHGRFTAWPTPVRWPVPTPRRALAGHVAHVIAAGPVSQFRIPRTELFASRHDLHEFVQIVFRPARSTVSGQLAAACPLPDGCF